MAEVSLTTKVRAVEYAPMTVNLTNGETGEVQKFEYQVRRLSKKEGLQVQLDMAEFAKDPEGRNLAGFRALGWVLADVKAPEGAPAIMDLFDTTDDDEQLAALTNALVEAATKSNLTE